MTPEQFTYWLQGYFEISDSKMLSSRQTQIIKDHLDLVFNKVTPDRSSEVIHDLGETKSKGLLLDSSPAITHELPGTIECEKNWSEVIRKSIENSLKIQNNSEDSPKLCETAQRFGLGKCNIRTTLYC